MNDIRLILNAHISEYINAFDVIQIGGDSLFQELPTIDHMPNSAEKRERYSRFTKKYRDGILPDRAPFGNHIGPETSTSLNLVTTRSSGCRPTQSNDEDFDTRGAISSRIL